MSRRSGGGGAGVAQTGSGLASGSGVAGELRERGVAVVGMSGLEGGAVSGSNAGVGKSCLCNRFVRSEQDDYQTDHISLLSQNDFGGRVVNNDHFLYWGEASRMMEDGTQYKFRVIEQTEFIDDTSFAPFKCGKTEQYFKRCAATKLQSAEKLMYICKDQLGLETEYPQQLLPDGRINIDGFLCVYDVSKTSSRDVTRQTDMTLLILQQLLKTKKPVVLATSKNDDVCDAYVKEVEKLLNRKELRSANITVVETSAEANVNVDQAFLVLAQLMDKAIKQKLPKLVPFAEAARSIKERKVTAAEAYRTLIRSAVTDYKLTWESAYDGLLRTHPDTPQYIALCGTDAAKTDFRRHTASIREEYVRIRQSQYLGQLQNLLVDLFPDLSAAQDRSWPSTCRWLRNQIFFEDYFLDLGPDALPWQQSALLEDTAEKRIPFDLLQCSDAEGVYRDHLARLRAEFRRNEWRAQFRKCLEENENVCAGKSLEDLAIFLLSRECFTALSEEDKSAIYAEHQARLAARARRDFSELLLEQAELFARFDSSPVSSDDIFRVSEALKQEPRFLALRCLPQERHDILVRHLEFMQAPSSRNCVFGDQCVDRILQHILFTRARRPQSWSRNAEFLLDSDDNRLNLAILGPAELTTALADQIKSQCVEDEYTVGDQLYSLDYRLIDGDVTLPGNSLKTPEFTPHGCFCLFKNQPTLQFIESNLEKTVLSSASTETEVNASHFQGLPVVLVLAHDPDLSEQRLQALRQQARQLAERLQCRFVDVPSAMMEGVGGFHGDQVSLAMHSLLQCIRLRSTLFHTPQLTDSLEPDIKLLMCFMCGDPYNFELPLAPLLNHQCCYVNRIECRFPTVTLETYVKDSKRRVEVTVAAYHDTSLLKEELFHGYLLVFSPLRRASLANLKAFSVRLLAGVPVRVVAMSEGGADAVLACEHSRGQLLDGSVWVDELNEDRGRCSFMTANNSFHAQTASYTSFFVECWEQKSRTEEAHSFCSDTLSGQLQRTHIYANQSHASAKQQPFSTFGKKPQHVNPSDPWEPLYERPTLERCYSDGESSEQAANSARTNGHKFIGQNTSPYATSSVVRDDFGLMEGAKRNQYNYRSLRHAKSGTLDVSSGESQNSPVLTLRGGTLHQTRGPVPFAPGGEALLLPGGAGLLPPGHPHNATQDAGLQLGDYAQVRDALEQQENVYAEVCDALPGGRLHLVRHAGGPQPYSNDRVRSNSPSEGSEGATDDSSTQNGAGGRGSSADASRKPVKKRRSFKKKSTRNKEDLPLMPGVGGAGLYGYGESDQDSSSANASLNKGFVDDDTSDMTSPRSETDGGDESGRWRQLLTSLMTAGDKGSPQEAAEKQRKKEEKRKLKEEEKRQKEQQKAQKRAQQQSVPKIVSRRGGAPGHSPLLGGEPRGSVPPAPTLTELVASNPAGGEVPALVALCVEYIEKEGLSAEGLYRVPGNRAQVELLQDIFSQDPRVDLSAHDIPVNAAATALKQFFNDLPEPLIPSDHYDKLICVAGLPQEEERLKAVRAVLGKMPAVNQQVLKYLVTHLYKVSENSKENLMSIDNLAVCWWPTILRPSFDNFESMNQVSKYLEELIKLILREYKTLFYNSE